jgi:hypothetical protein
MAQQPQLSAADQAKLQMMQDLEIEMMSDLCKLFLDPLIATMLTIFPNFCF